MTDASHRKSAKSVEKTVNLPDDIITKLNSEIRALEQELADLRLKLQPFQNLVYAQLQIEIRQLAELSELHKKYKADKKRKRLEQKKRGKNYKPPVLRIQNLPNQVENPLNEKILNPELKKLYREAIIKIHPDKISHNSESDAIQAATDLTAQLNQIYKNGDLDELKLFYYALSGDELVSKKAIDNNERLRSKDYQNLLINTQSKLLGALEELKASSLFYYLSKNKTPQEFVDDLRERLHDKIRKLEKRTRNMK